MSEWKIKPKISFESTFFSFSPLIEKFSSVNNGLPNSTKFDFSGLKSSFYFLPNALQMSRRF